MLRLLYQSRTVFHRESPGLFFNLATMLEEGLVRNPPCGVTSVLAFYDHRFAQLIEGPEPGVLTLFDRVSRDQRHEEIRIVLRETTERRLFEGWAMAFLGVECGLGPLFAELELRPTPAVARKMVGKFAALVN